MTTKTAPKVTAPTFERGPIPKKAGGVGRTADPMTLAFVAAATESDKDNAARWLTTVKGVGVKAANLRKRHPNLKFTVRGQTIYGYNPSL